MSFNTSMMRLMEKWTEVETPHIVQGHQTHWPITSGGKTVARLRLKKGSSGSGKKRRKTWFK